MLEYEDSLGALESEQSAPREELPVSCEFITGIAGSGKTYMVMQKVREDSQYGILSASTGIASVNLSAITVHSLLRYSTTDVLRDCWLSGKLTRVVHSLAKRYRRLIVDEASMVSAHQLDLWYRAVQAANRYHDIDESSPMGITLVGDMLQLAPVKEPWVFTAQCWKEFTEHTTRITKVWRQDSAEFLDALNLVRAGHGGAAAERLTGLGAQWHTSLDTEFDGTTILPRNDQVSRFNQMALDRVQGEEFTVTSRRWGAQQSEWGQSKMTKEWGIPPSVKLKHGAYVMILSNKVDFEFANGDCGWIEGHDEDFIHVRLVRTGKVVEVGRVVRGVEYSEKPDAYCGTVNIPKDEDDGGYVERQHWRGRVKRYCMGQIEYWPLRLAYASTVHKTQSLTLDRCQVDFRDRFFSMPGMCYVSLSRARTLAGLRLVGQRDTFAGRCTVDERVRSWI